MGGQGQACGARRRDARRGKHCGRRQGDASVVDPAYELYCLADPVFYDSPLRGRSADPDLAVATRPLPDGWDRADLDDWLAYHPRGAQIPPQGWKIHVSTCLDNAEEGAATEGAVK